jgi:hypothetical protein
VEIEKTTAQLVGPNGEVINKPTEVLTTEEAELLRKYKTFLRRHNYREALYCARCWDGGLSDGTEAYVTDSQVVVKCRCRLSFYQGQTF